MNGLPLDHPRDRLISITLAMVCLVVAVPVAAIFIAGFRHRPLDVAGATFLVAPFGLMALAGALLWEVRNRRVPRWFGGGLRTVLLAVLVPFLGGALKFGVNAIESIVATRWGVSSRMVDLVAGLIITAALVLFAVCWRRASGTVPHTEHTESGL